MDGYLPSLGADAFGHVPAFGAYDVVVVGGGPAGIATDLSLKEDIPFQEIRRGGHRRANEGRRHNGMT